jgi:pimeloyl-ACP methyl ester carboxylesterase
LLVPGTGFGRGTWGRFRELAAARFRVIAYDRRGFAESASEPAASMRVNADDAAALLEHLNATPAHVLGWSAGGLVALSLAIEHPHAVRSLTLVEPSLHGLRHATPSAVGMTLRARAKKLLRGQRAATDLSYRWTFAYRGRGESAWDRMPSEWREQVLARAESVAVEEDQETSLSYPRRRAIADLACPIKLVLGELSQGYFHRVARYVGHLNPRCELVVVRGASHAVHLDAAEELAAAIG